jgi:lipoyl(octanoyl) transferase
MRKVQLLDWSLIPYREAWDKQAELFNLVLSQKKEAPTVSDNFLVFCSHNPVFTLGKSGKIGNLLVNEVFLKSVNAEVVRVNRGGDITFHGPQQLVVYPILNLHQFATDIGLYMCNLEEVVILTLKDFNIKGKRMKDFTGVWIDQKTHPSERKICAMGVKTSNWVTMHGLAINVNVDLKYFSYINPCGITDKEVTSMQKELGENISMKMVKESLKKHFEAVFECKLEE